MEEQSKNPERLEDEVNEVVLLDEAGREVHFDHLMTFLYEQERYIALLPLDPVENVGEDEVILLHVVSKDNEDIYETIDNEVLLEEVFDAFLELFDEMVEQED